MSEFINKFASAHKKPTDDFVAKIRHAFIPTIELFQRTLGREAFRPIKALNAAVFDSTMVGVANRLAKGKPLTELQLTERYAELMLNAEYGEATQRSTSDDSFVRKR